MTKVLGVSNTLSALQCLKHGFDHLYISGGQLHAFEYGLADLNILGLEELLEVVKKVKRARPKELWVDIDAGQCSNLKLSYHLEKLAVAGATGVQIEDQPLTKRCGHRDGKSIIDIETMVKRIKTIKKSQAGLKVIARSDALHLETQETFQRRIELYQESGADILFIEALTCKEQLEFIKGFAQVPVMVNRTEFGKTPNLSDSYWELAQYHLLPITLSRLMHGIIDKALTLLAEKDGQTQLLDQMLTRDELYSLIDYQASEKEYCSLL